MIEVLELVNELSYFYFVDLFCVSFRNARISRFGMHTYSLLMCLCVQNNTNFIVVRFVFA